MQTNFVFFVQQISLIVVRGKVNLESTPQT